MSAINVSNLGKAYKQYHNRWSRLAEWLSPFRATRHNLKWILRDINFTINSGEAVGIIGINGAGKSTLLKLITGTTQPTTGKVEVSGRIAALLELGMGFHPDFTGRENAFMAGQLLGYSVEDIARHMPSIEEFADIGGYIDQPVRVYSSGMQVRLAFSVATAMRPSVLIIDEALAVGDIAFQRKCFARIEEYRKQGTTLLFVSHDLEAVKKLCDRAMFIHQGSIKCIDTPKAVCEAYERVLFQGHEEKSRSETPGFRTRLDPNLATGAGEEYGDKAIIIADYRLENANGDPSNVFAGGEAIVWRFQAHFQTDIANPIFSMMIKTREGLCVYYTDSRIMNIRHGSFSATDVCEIEIVLQNNLAPGYYFINCAVRTNHGENETVHHRLVDAASIAVSPRQEGQYPGGLADLAASITLKQ